MISDFAEPLECLARDLPATIAAARAAGFEAHQMVALPEVVFRLRFWKTNAATGHLDALEGHLDADRVVETVKVISCHPDPSKDFGQSHQSP